MREALYAHWLDGEFLHPRCGTQDQLDKRRSELEDLLKLHALFGNSLHLSDMQLIDSRLVLELFANPGFFRFISRCPDFFRLVASPQIAADEFKTQGALAVVGAGLARARRPGWISSLFKSPRITKDVADKFASVKSKGEAQAFFRKQHTIMAVSNTDRLYLRGMFCALKHFTVGVGSDQVESSEEKSRSFLDILNTLEGVDYPAVARSIKSTIKFAMGSHARSTILKQWRGTVTGPQRRLYLNIVQAWNLNVSRSVHADYDSAYIFRGTFPLPMYFGELDQIVAPVGQVGDDELFRNVEKLQWHPRDIEWAQIAQVRKVIQTKALCEAPKAIAEAIVWSRPHTGGYAWIEKVSDAVPLLKPLITFCPKAGGVMKGIEWAIKLAKLSASWKSGDINATGDALEKLALRYRILRKPQGK